MKEFKEQVSELISKELGISSEEVYSSLTVPPRTDMGDIAYPCFKLAKEMSRSPHDIAKDLSGKLSKIVKNNIKEGMVESVKEFGPYVNFSLNKKKFYSLVISDLMSKKVEKTSSKKHGTVVIDYSSPNIAKPIAFHHIRSTVIGNIIGNIFEHNGYEVIRINYLGDWGTQFGKLITAYEEYGDEDKLQSEGIRHLLDIYVKYHKEENETLNDTAKNWFRLMEAGDKKALAYWKKFRDISIKEFDRVYKRLGVSFTSIEGESFYNGKTEPVIKDLDKKIGIKESEGAIIIDLSAFDMPPMLLKKTDGTTLYATRDIAAAMDRWKRFSFAESLYVVANQQELHFKQLFKVLELMKTEWASRCKHVQFGLLHFEDAKMSTREGRVIFLEEVLDKSIELAKKAIEEKNPDLENKADVAEAVGVGAIIFGDISKRRIQDITFTWDDVLSFDGETAPYVQYTHARACSILSKANYDVTRKLDEHGLGHDSLRWVSSNYDPTDLEFELVKLISLFGERLIEAQMEYEPFILARYVLDLCQTFNKYYYQEKIIDVKDEEQKNAKLALVYSVKKTIKNSLSIMGIKAPERM